MPIYAGVRNDKDVFLPDNSKIGRASGGFELASTYQRLPKAKLGTAELRAFWEAKYKHGILNPLGHMLHWEAKPVELESITPTVVSEPKVTVGKTRYIRRSYKSVVNTGAKAKLTSSKAYTLKNVVPVWKEETCLQK